MDDFKFEIVKEIGVISENAKGWKKKLTLVSWNGRPAKYDIREWSEDDSKMSKGITFTEDEIKELKSLLEDVEL